VGLRTQPTPDWTWNRPHDAAVTMLRDYGGTFPSQAEMSEAKAYEEPAEGGLA